MMAAGAAIPHPGSTEAQCSAVSAVLGNGCSPQAREGAGTGARCGRLRISGLLLGERQPLPVLLWAAAVGCLNARLWLSLL